MKPISLSEEGACISLVLNVNLNFATVAVNPFLWALSAVCQIIVPN